MNEINCFLDSHYNLKQVVLMVEKDFSIEELQQFIKHNVFMHLILVSHFDKEKIQQISDFIEQERKKDEQSMPERFEYFEFDDFNGLSDEWVLCAVGLSSRKLLGLAHLAPTYLLASIEQDYISAFDIWEVYRNKTSYIQIKTIRPEVDNQMLVWEQNDSDVELSIIFPVYNVESYLENCIDSVTAWDAPYIEFLFINDGSPDNSRDIILKASEKDSRIKLIDKENGGCASARQKGLDIAKGRYIGFIDPDDFIDESMFKKLLKAAMVGSYDISYCGFNRYYNNKKNSNIVYENIFSKRYCMGTQNKKDILDRMLFSHIAIWRCIYKKELIEEYNIHFYTDIKRFDDFPFFVEISSVAKSIVAVNEYLYFYRLEREGQDVACNDEKLYVHFDIFNYLNQSVMTQKHPILTDYLYMIKLNNAIWALTKIRDDLKTEYIEMAIKEFEGIKNPKRFIKMVRMNFGKSHMLGYKAIMNKNANYFMRLNKNVY